MKRRWPYTETSPCPPGHTRDVFSIVFAGLSMFVKNFDPVVIADKKMIAAEGEI